MGKSRGHGSQRLDIVGASQVVDRQSNAHQVREVSRVVGTLREHFPARDFQVLNAELSSQPTSGQLAGIANRGHISHCAAARDGRHPRARIQLSRNPRTKQLQASRSGYALS